MRPQPIILTAGRLENSPCLASGIGKLTTRVLAGYLRPRRNSASTPQSGEGRMDEWTYG